MCEKGTEEGFTNSCVRLCFPLPQSLVFFKACLREWTLDQQFDEERYALLYPPESAASVR